MQFFDKGVLTVQKIVELLQAQFLDKGVDVPARLVVVVPETVEVLQLLVDVGLSSSWTRFQLLDEVVDVPVVVHVLVYGMMKTVEVPQVQFIERVSSSSWTKLLKCPFVHVEGPDVQKTFGGAAGAVHRLGFVQLLDEVIDGPAFVHVQGPDV